MTLNFYGNIFGIASNNIFQRFQANPEVVGKILSDKNQIGNNTPYGLGFMVARENLDSAWNYVYTDRANAWLNKSLAQEDYIFWAYKSEVGLHGFCYAYLFNHLHCSFEMLQFLTAFLTAIGILIIALQFAKIIHPLFGIAFFVSMFLSPWIIGFASSLYFAIFLWFPPVICANLLYLQRHTRRRYLWAFLFMLSIFIKSLCGYEYLSTVILFSLSVFLISPFLAKKNTLRYKTAFWYVVLLSVLVIIGFGVAFSIHAYFRGEGHIFNGIMHIYKEDVLRRTLGGDANLFDHPLMKASIKASILEVLKIYMIDWGEDCIGRLSGKNFFPLLLIISFIIVVFSKKQYHRKEYIILLIVFILPALSWLGLGKQHSYIHRQMNFIVWYAGFFAVLYYVPLHFICRHIRQYVRRKYPDWKINKIAFRSHIV